MENLGELAAPVQNPVLFGCVSGSIGMVAMLPHSLFQLLADIQKRLTKVVRSLGNIEHSLYPPCVTEPIQIDYLLFIISLTTVNLEVVFK